MEEEPGRGLATALAAAGPAALHAGSLAAAPAARRWAEGKAGGATTREALDRRGHHLRIEPHVPASTMPYLDCRRPCALRDGFLVRPQRPSRQQGTHVHRHGLRHLLELGSPNKGLNHVSAADGDNLLVGRALQIFVHSDLLLVVEHARRALQEARVRPLHEGRDEDVKVDGGDVAVLDVKAARLQDREGRVHRALGKVDAHLLELLRSPLLQMRRMRARQHVSAPAQEHDLLVGVLDADVTCDLQTNDAASGNDHRLGVPDRPARRLDLLLPLLQRLPRRGHDQGQLESRGDNEDLVWDRLAARTDEHLLLRPHLLSHLHQVGDTFLLVLLRVGAQELVMSLRPCEEVGGGHGPFEEAACHDDGDVCLL
mmetsp:Transcript_116938/g.283598  ORF Transcript_116938/g.283598 Transcript_116938/m.283598 type:complete len:370 (-) Transcript_116938:111-1220(-)